MTVLEATVELAKAALSTGTSSQVFIFNTPENTKEFIKGLTEIYKALEKLEEERKLI